LVLFSRGGLSRYDRTEAPISSGEPTPSRTTSEPATAPPILPFDGGHALGPRAAWEAPAGASADWQIVLRHGTAFGDIRYALQTDGGALLYVQSQGVQRQPGSQLAQTRAANLRDNAHVGAREERLAENEGLFREVNERVAEVATLYIDNETHRAVDFTCECGRVDCSETMMMTIVEYEAIRAHSTHFGVVPHEQPEIESVIERHPSYFVVEKREQDAQEVARDTDPRA
jgi:hypothetical protein